MYYKMIDRARDRWYASPDYTVADLIGYMIQRGHLRDAQIEAIKTYLYLKIACNCQSLKQLFCQGAFNTLDLDDLEISKSTREFLKGKKAAAALLEYALLINDAGDQVSPKLAKQIKKDPESIDYERVFNIAFYGVSYTDYLFSLDEVHHAVSDEIKLRAVVNRCAENDTVNSVIGFSGTPYLDKAEKIPIVDKLSVATAEITNIVYYYPLIAGVGNFLKRPVVKISDVADSEVIIEAGVREFLNAYKDKVYAGGLAAKLAIYCGRIAKLEEMVYPLVSRIIAEYGLPSDAILKYYGTSTDKQYKAPADSQMQFDTLDNPISRIRIVLLVQIGKEGWDCRSLTGIILSQEGDCPKNMVLQTSCRCLRQVGKGMPETALIYLNDTNADIGSNV